jgi:beta-galactosidase/beta-glucuronidase
VHPTHPAADYPRPHFDRSYAWESLNGTWDFAFDAGDVGTAEGWQDGQAGPWPEQITVPVPWEHPASGIARHWSPIGWYRRAISRPVGWADQRLILHFGAVHHAADVWVNGIHVARHVGGYLPFEADVTDALDDDGAGIVVIRAEAPIDKRHIPHGKQRSIPADDYEGCAFTPSSGIWQSVWLEPRPSTYISDLRLRPLHDLSGIDVTVDVSGPDADTAAVTIDVAGSVHDAPGGQVVVALDDPRLWSPADPHLYRVTATVRSAGGADVVSSYTGLRRIEWHERQLHLNGSPIFVRGVLDQGFWPTTGHAAPSADALRRDLELAREAGFNLVRMHLKLEDPRWLHYADQMGMLVWAEPPSTGRYGTDAVGEFENVLAGMIDRDANHPSIVIWGAYNEEWGLDWDVPDDPAKQEAVRRAYRLVRDLDPSRPVVDNSGWAHVETDLVDWHYYDEDAGSWARTVAALADGKTDGFSVRLGENFVVTKHIKAPGFADDGKPWLNGEYGGGATSVERGWHLHWQTQELRRHERVAGYIYTELYDIEHETVGIYTYDRRHKDLGARAPSDVNAETTLIVDITPEAPGRDLVAAGELTLPVRVSHHGQGLLSGRLRVAWTSVMSEPPGDSSSLWTNSEAPRVDVKPFAVTDSVDVIVVPPDNVRSARLHIALVADGAVRARTAVDIVMS